MLGWNVERLEVMPLVLDFWSISRREAEPAHDVFQLLDRLRNRVQPSQPKRHAGQSEVELRAGFLRSALRGDPLLGGRECRLDGVLDLIESLTGRRLVFP